LFSFSQLYIGLTTGLCGSITTFSGLMYNSCVALFGPSSHFTYPVSNYLSVITSAFSSSYIGFIIGRHLSIFLLPSSQKTKRNVQYLNDHVRIWLFPVLIILSIPLLVLLAVLLPVGHYTYIIYSVIFAPFGSLTRYLLSLIFNTNPNFPYGTFLANVLGSYLYLGMVSITQYVHTLSPLTKQIINSIIQGYCGCLTTVSTFILELDTMKKRRYIYLYFILSLLSVQIVYIIFGDIFSLICSPSS
jgi:fluoride ion exporter CrcB/FEX